MAHRRTMDEAVQATRQSLSALASGRVTPRLLARVRVRAYGGLMPLEHVATVGIAPPRTLLVTPHEPGTLAAVERALSAADLGGVPSNDGRVVRLTVPAPTSERKEELARAARLEAERGRVMVRNERRDRNNELKRKLKTGEIVERQLRGRTKDIQTATDEAIAQIDSALSEALADLDVHKVGA